ncbi:uncharacterized protein LOC129911107 [Episyrphus balteatus]|uniref:uncharacterized protein LOC129911107 n=1 Tax=Episyrphus balteatus TaxID=286459 RepID=UPI002485F3E6|nr:uncharacterized protein LOC129911107 [Episyrphus balteatus]
MSPASIIWFGVFLCGVLVSAEVQSDVKDVIRQFPWNIDPQFSQPIHHQRSAAAQSPLDELFKVPAVKDLIQYLEKHGIQAEKMFSNFIRIVQQYEAFANASSIGDVFDIMFKILPMSEVSAVVKEKIRDDPEFAKLAQVIKSPQFKALFYRALNAKATCAGCNGQVRGFSFSVGFSISFVIASADVQSDVKDSQDIINQFPWDNDVIQPRSSSLEELFKVPAVQDLVQYFEKHGIQVEKMIVNFMKSINQYEAFSKVTSIGDIVSVIFKNFSLPEVVAMIEKKKKSDPEFAKLARAIRNPEFMGLFYRALNAKATCVGCNGQEVRRFKFSAGISVSIGK